MGAGPLRDALTLLLGLATGVLSGAFGIGGAVISTPGIRLLGASATLAIGSTLPSVLPSSIAGTLRYHHEKLVEWKAVEWVVPPGIIASIGGALVTDLLPCNRHPPPNAPTLPLCPKAVRPLRPPQASARE